MGEADANWDPMSEAYQSAEVNVYNMKFPSRHSGEENLCLFVSGFPSTVTSHAVRNLLSEAGQIQYVKTVPDRKKWSNIIAYVYAATYKDALAIIGGFNNFTFLNSTLRIGFTMKRKTLTDPAGQGNVGSAVETRGSLSGLNQTLSDVESLGARPGKADVMDFQRLGPHPSQQKPPMGRAKLLMSLTSDELKTTTVGRKSWNQPLAAADRRGNLSDGMEAAADGGDNAELQSKYCDQLKQLSSSSAVRRKDEEDKTKDPQSVSPRGLIQNERQVDNASTSSHSSVSSAKKCPDLCAFCQNPGQLLCSVCKTTYCSQSCQRIDWPHHKNICQSKRSKPDSATNFADYENEFLVGVDVDELSSSLEINLPDGKKFATAHVKLMESSLPVDACTEVVLVTAPVSPSEIWVVEGKHSELLDNIKKSLRKHYSGVQTAQRSSVQLMLNDYCVCLFSVDGCWYRTRVESVNRDGTFDVRYIDYGNLETVPSSRIDVLEEEFCSVPSLAVRCRLSDLVPSDGSGVWSNRALRLCSELLPVLKVLNVKCIQKTANVHSIELVNAAGKRISDEFLEAGVAKHLSNSTKLSLSEKVQEEKISPTDRWKKIWRTCPGSERIEKKRDTFALEHNKVLLNLLCNQFRQKFQEVQQKFYTLSKEDQLKVSLSPLPLSPSGSEIVKEIVVTSPHGMPTASKHLFRGAKVLVKVLNLVSPTQFWVHLVSTGPSELDKLSELEASMKEHYEKKPSKKGFSLTARMLYAAKCSLTGRWLRVHVLKFDRSGVDAFLLDYGVCQVMSLVSLISLEGQFCSLPFQAVHCTLAGIGPKAGSTAWTQGTVAYLQRLIDHPSNAEHLEAAVCRVDGACAHLELVLPCGETINNLLVKYGMAEFVPDLQPGFFVLSRNLISGGKTFSEGRASTSPLNLQVSPAQHSTGEPVEGLLKKLEAPPVHLPISSETPKLKNLVRSPLATDKIHEVIVTDATHFFGFYVQVVTVDKATELQSLEEKINEIYGDYRGSFRPSVGDIVAARFSVDQKWYRGLVREVTSPDSALVMFLDYGNCDNVAVKFISPLDASLLTVPVFAYRCALLEPTGVVFVQPWNEDFLLPLSATFQMKVVKEKENVHVVDLFSKDLNTNWKDKLLRDGVIQLKLTSTVDLSKPSSSSAGHSVSPSVDERVATSVAGNLRPKVEVGSAVCIVHINSVTDFYVHVKDKDLEKMFDDLMQRLKDECDKCTLSSYVPKGPGEVAAALYDNIWYRAKVLQITSPTACRMEFVDFGNVDLVACSCLRPLPSDCQLDALPEMAVPCCLFNLCGASPKGGSGDCLDVESSKWFRKLCLEKQFTVTGICNVVSNRYALDLRSTEISGTVRDCYLKMFSDQKVSPLAESTTAGKPPADQHHVAQVASSSPCEQQPRAPVAPSAQRPSDKRVHFANDLRAPQNAQSGGNSQLGPAGSMQSGSRSTSNDQSNFKSIGSQPYGSKPTGYHQSGNRATGGGWPDRNPNTMNVAAPRSNQNGRPQFAENRQPESKFRDGNCSVPKITERHQADPEITEKRRSGSEVSENNGQGPMIAENNVSGSKVTSAVAVEGSGHAADKRSCVVAETEKSRHLQSLEKSDKVVLSSRQQLPTVSQSVSVVHINSPSDFYIQLCDEESKGRMNKFLAEFHQCALALIATPYSNGRVGDCVAGLFDNCWFRAEVVELLQGDRARLFFVDYGNISVVEFRNIRSTMPKELLSRPWLAIRCTIEGVVGNETNGEWSKDAIAWFSQRFENDTCTVKTVIPPEGDQPCVVDLVGSQAKESIKEQIISNRYGAIVSPKRAEKTNSFVANSTGTQSSDGVCLIDLTSPESLENLSNKLPIQQSVSCNSPLPRLGRAVAVEGGGHAPDNRSCVVAESEKSRHLQSLEKSDKVVLSRSRQLPTVSQSVSVVHINSPSDFYIQLCDEESKERMNKFLAEFHQCALALSATPYSNGRVGDCLAGLFDNCWFRAEVVELLQGDRARLFFVDYGNVSVVEFRNIRSTMPKELLSKPWLAIRCTIEGVVGNEANGEWSRDAIAWFSHRFENDTCTVKTVIPPEGDQPCVVDLVGSQAKESIKEQIISNRFGEIVSRKRAEKTIALENESKSALAVTAGYADGKVLGKVEKVGNDLVKTGIVSPASMPCGAAVKVIHSNKPSEFFVQSADEAVQLSIAQVCLDLTAHCSDSTQNSYRPSAVGEYVAALFEGMWFRAQVLKILQQDQFELFFVDFGNCDIIGASNIRVLPAKFVSIMPKQAISCGIVRLAGTDGAEKWSDESCAWFKGYCENFDFHVQAVVLDDSGKCLIDMLRTGDQHSIREQLLSSHRAVELTDQNKLLSDSDRGCNKETNTLTTGSSCDKTAGRVIASNVGPPQSMLSPAERNRGGTGATVVHNQAEARHTTVVAASRPTHDANARNVRSAAQEFSSVVNQPTLSANRSAASASYATSAANHVSVASNQPTANTDLIKSSVNNTKSSVDSPRMAAVKPGSSTTINCGDVVTIVHVNSPSDFYVQLQTDSLQREIVELLKKLNEWCTSSASGAKPYRPTGEGEIVAANFEGIWYRAEVLDVCQDSKYELRFIDYGNVDAFDVADIRRLPATLINILPRQAMPCAISGVKPVEPDGCWSPEAVGWFRENTENVSSFVVRSSSLTAKGTYLVDVYTVLPNGNQELSLCEKLISLKFGRSTDTAASRNSQSSLISDIRPTGQSNDRSIARSTGQSSDAAVGGQIQRETRCSRSVFKFDDLPELRLSSDVTVEVTLPTDPGSFWCQDLLQMADMIKRFQFQEPPPPSHPASASSGLPKVVTEKNEVCLGFHDKYGEWYRVVVKDVREDCLTVRFMDYGDETTVPFDHVRPFPAELKSFPPLAIHCSLAGVAAVGNGWTEQAKAVFHSLVSSQILSASIKSHDSKTDDYKVILKVQSSGQVVGDELVAAGLAKRV